jgi:hypothetical protein
MTFMSRAGVRKAVLVAASDGRIMAINRIFRIVVTSILPAPPPSGLCFRLDIGTANAANKARVRADPGRLPRAE